MTPQPFVATTSDAAIADLNSRLQQTRLIDDFSNDDWAYGVERGWLGGMLNYWINQYDWRAQEAAINALPHFRTEISGVNIHFMQIRAKTVRSLPLVVTHGWPWTFWDWHRMIGPLTDPLSFGGSQDDGFDLIIPSLPGFGYSSPLTQTGLAPPAIARLWHQLMQEQLGYRHYGAAGGDWGAFVSAEMAQQQPTGLCGVHLAMPVVPGLDIRTVRREDFAEDEVWMADQMAQFAPTVQSHIMVHSRDPQTLAYALADSPIGLAAWLWERRHNWSHRDGNVLDVFSAEFLCTTASIYWFTRTIGTSMRIYAERQRLGVGGHWVEKSPVPVGYAIAPRDVMMVPRRMAEQRSHVARWTVLPRGGHFLPMEQPLLLAHEYREFFRPLR